MAERALWDDYHRRRPPDAVEILLTHIAVILAGGKASHEDFSPWLGWRGPPARGRPAPAAEAPSLELCSLDLIVDAARSRRRNATSSAGEGETEISA